MKRLLLAAAALCGSFCFLSSTASAQPVDNPTTRSFVATASGSPEIVLAAVMRTAPLVRVTVRPGDTLSGIAATHHSQWPRLAAYDHISNPDLIFVGQVVTVPPAGYTGWYTGAPAPAVVSHYTRYTPPVRTIRSYSAPVQRYTPQVQRSVVANSSGGWDSQWACIAQHESGGNPATNTGNGYYGGLQFTMGTWQAYGGSGNPANASIAQQEAVANRVVAASGGYGAWPNTSRMCGQ